MVMILSKKAVVDVPLSSEYYDFIEKERVERGLSFQAYVRYLVFEKIDDLKKEELRLQANVVPKPAIEVEEVKEKKKDMLKNLNRLKK